MGYRRYSVIKTVCIIIVAFNAFTANAQVVYNGPKEVHETQSFTITCNSSLYVNFKWRGPITDLENDRQANIRSHNELDRKISILTISSASATYSGNYKCSYDHDDYGFNITVIVVVKLTASYDGDACNSEPSRSSQPISIGAGSDSTIKCTVAAPYENAFSLKCSTDTPLLGNQTIAWYKVTSNDKNDLGQLIEKRDHLSISDDSKNSELKFATISPDDTGKYHCRVVGEGKEKDLSIPFAAAQIIELRVLPWVKIGLKDITAIEESPVNLTCLVLSNVSSEVTWQVNNTQGSKMYTQSEGRVKLSNFNGSTNANLVIESANASIDLGQYTCFAKNAFGSSHTNATFNVRVKSKYAALWPFLGICAEVIILCTVILIYEKKRDKTELEESDTDQGPETKSSPDHGQDNVRYRK